MMNIPHVFTSLKNRLQAILLIVLTLLMPANLLAQEPYAVLSNGNTVLTFYYDDQMTARGGMSVGPFSGASEVSWYDNRESITSVVFDDSFAGCTTLTSTASWFSGLVNLTSVVGISNLKTDNVTDMSYMFYGCEGLTSLDLSSFNTANVTYMLSMFDGCTSLTSLDLSNFNTANVTEMTSMFLGCTSLTSLDLSSFNTANVTYMHAMFRDCTSLTSLDLSNFNTANVTVMSYMFAGCSSLTSLDLSSFNTANVTDFEEMFSYCSSLAAIQAGSAAIPAEVYANIGNPNLLVYVDNASVAPQGIQNVVVNGVAPEITLSDESNWYCPQPFTAEKISYTRTFSQETQVGVSRGWETIALPFDVQSVTHETRGVITPFGDASSAYHFWLRRLTSNGLQSVLQIEANTPYLISMPNSTEYPEEYKLAGKVTFSAENASVPESNLVIDESSDIFFSPTFDRMEAQDYIYAINVGEERGGHPEGSVFEQNYREVRPFEAYTKHLTGPSRFITLDDLDEGFATSIEELKNGRGEGLKDGRMEGLKDSYYDLNGRRVLRPSKGVFIHHGKQVIFK